MGTAVSVLINSCIDKRNQHQQHQNFKEAVQYFQDSNNCVQPPTQGSVQPSLQNQHISPNRQRQGMYPVKKMPGLPFSGMPAVGPGWLGNVVHSPNTSVYGFDVTMDHCSNKFLVEGTDRVLRNTPTTDTHTTDSAKIKTPISSGKHVFEIEWFKATRGTFATVGVGVIQTPRTVKGKTSLVGSTHRSWGFDISRRRLINNDKVLDRCPKEGHVPEVFYMFIDMDDANGGNVSFGSYDEFWGEAFSDLKRKLDGSDLYVIVSTNLPQARIRVTYQGQFVHPSNMMPMAPGLPSANMMPPQYNSLDVSTLMNGYTYLPTVSHNIDANQLPYAGYVETRPTVTMPTPVDVNLGPTVTPTMASEKQQEALGHANTSQDEADRSSLPPPYEGLSSQNDKY